MNKFTNAITSSLAALTLLVMLSACTESSGPSPENVPATADYLVRLDIDRLTDGATDAEGIALPEDWDALAELADKVGPTADFSDVLIYKVGRARYPFAAVRVADRDAFVKALGEADWVKRDADGAEAYQQAESSERSACIVIEGEGAWYLASRADVKAWRESLKEAEKDNFSKYMADSDNDRILTGVVNPSAAGLGSGKEMIRLTGELSTASGTLTVDAEPFDPVTGQPVAFAALAPIDDNKAISFMPLMPSGPSLTLLAGIPKGIDWSGLIEMFGADLGTRNQGMLQSLLPYLTSLDGPLAIGLGPLDGKSLESDDIESQRLIICASLEGSRATDAVEEINRNLREKGVTPRPRADGIYAFTLDEVTYRYTARDGAFIFALNREIDPASDAVTIAEVSGTAQLKATLELPQLRSLVPGAPTDIALAARLRIDDKGCHLELTTRPAANPLAALKTYLKAVEKHTREVRQQAADYYDDYD